MTETIQSGTDRTPDQPSISQLKRSWFKLKRNKVALVGGFLILLYILTALLAPVLFPGNPSAPNLKMALETPSLKHPLGTDELGVPYWAGSSMVPVSHF